MKAGGGHGCVLGWSTEIFIKGGSGFLEREAQHGWDARAMTFDRTVGLRASSTELPRASASTEEICRYGGLTRADGVGELMRNEWMGAGPSTPPASGIGL